MEVDGDRCRRGGIEDQPVALAAPEWMSGDWRHRHEILRTGGRKCFDERLQHADVSSGLVAALVDEPSAIWRKHRLHMDGGRHVTESHRRSIREGEHVELKH